MIQPTVINTGGYGNPTDGFRAVDAKFKEMLGPYKKLDFLQTGKIVEYSYDSEINTPIVYSDTEVSIIIKDRTYVVGIPGNLFDLRDLLNELDVGTFYLNEAENNLIVEGFQEYGDIIQDDMIVFSAGEAEDNDTMPSQADINREIALRLNNVSSTSILDTQWLQGGNELLAKGLIGSTNNQHVALIVNGVELLTLRTNKGWHRENKLFSIAYSDTNTSWGGGALTLMEDTATGNSAFGADALSKIVSGEFSTGLGNNALKAALGDYNTGAGYNSGKDLINGDDNTFYGARSGKSLINGNATTFVGSNTSTTTDGIHSSIALGFNVTLTKSNQFVIGADPDGDGYGAVTEMLTHYAASRSHTVFYTQASPVGVLTAERGSIAYVNTGSAGQAWLKTGATINSWEMIQTTTALAITNQEVVFGNGTTVVSSTNLKFNTSNNRLTLNGEIYAGLSTGLATDSVVKLNNSLSTSFFYLSTASPESVITAPRSSLAFVNTGSLGELWVKTSTAGSTGWSTVLTTSTGALMALSNLASVSINASLIPQTTKDLGAAATAWRDLYLYGSGTFGSHSLKFTGTPTGNRTLTFPDITDTIATLTATQTFTNKRFTKRIGTVTSSATPTINTDSVDMFTITALAAAITSFTTNLSGTPTTGQILRIRIKDDGTARAIAWGASFVTRIGTLPTTTVISKYLYVVFEWNEVALVWDCMATGQEA